MGGPLRWAARLPRSVEDLRLTPKVEQAQIGALVRLVPYGLGQGASERGAHLDCSCMPVDLAGADEMTVPLTLAMAGG